MNRRLVCFVILVSHSRGYFNPWNGITGQGQCAVSACQEQPGHHCRRSTLPHRRHLAVRQQVKDYVQKAGGFSDAADTTKALLRHANGKIETVSLDGLKSSKPQPGDEIMVLPEPNVKNLQFGKAIAEILFRVAVAANMLLTL